MRLEDLSKEGKEELALALILWKDFKCQGKVDLDILKQQYQLAEMLGIKKELEELLPAIPPMKIEERYK